MEPLTPFWLADFLEVRFRVSSVARRPLIRRRLEASAHFGRNNTGIFVLWSEIKIYFDDLVLK